MFCSIVWFEAFVSHCSSFNVLSGVADIFVEIDIWLVWTVHLEWQRYNPSCYTNKYIMPLFFYTRWSDPSAGYWLVVTARCPPGLWHFRSEGSGGNQLGDTVGPKISPSDFCLEGQCESHLDWLGCRQGGRGPASTTMHFRWCNVKAANTVDSIRSAFSAVKAVAEGSSIYKALTMSYDCFGQIHSNNLIVIQKFQLKLNCNHASSEQAGEMKSCEWNLRKMLVFTGGVYTLWTIRLIKMDKLFLIIF